MREHWDFEDQIIHNKRATVRLFITVFVLLWAMVFSVGFLLGYPPYVTAPLALIFGIIYISTASAFSVDAILKSARARPANPQIREEKLLLYKVEELSLAAGIPAPKVYVSESKDINAFATGKDPEHGVIAVTQGALTWLDQEELEGVLAHELSHIKNYDIRVSMYAIALIGIIAMLGEIIFWHFIFGSRGGGRRDMDPRIMLALFVVALATIIFAPLLSRMAYMAISRKREYLADASGAKMTRNPDGLARALEKIGGTEPLERHRGDKTVAGLYLANPLKRVRKDSIWATHPPIQERIARLRRM